MYGKFTINTGLMADIFLTVKDTVSSTEDKLVNKINWSLLSSCSGFGLPDLIEFAVLGKPRYTPTKRRNTGFKYSECFRRSGKESKLDN